MNNTKAKNNLEELQNEYKSFFVLEYPYGSMVEELVNSLYEKEGKIQGNYLTALGLFCYSEVIGREIIRHKYPTKKYVNNKECFNCFFSEYMGYKNLLLKFKDIYDWYRNGLCHNYKIKGVGNAETGVFVYYDQSSVLAFENFGVDTTKGILLSEKSSKRIFIILPYFADFIMGIEKFLKEKKNIA